MRIVLLLLILLLAAGCTSTLTEDQLRDRADAVRRDTMGRVDYLGRSHGYDYFRVAGNIGSVRYRLIVPNRIIHEPQSLQDPPRDMKVHAGGLNPEPFPVIPFPSLP